MNIVCFLCCQGIYQESPWLFLMVFGIPTFVISIICYTLCCMEPAEDDGTFEGSDDEEELREQMEGDNINGVALWLQ